MFLIEFLTRLHVTGQVPGGLKFDTFATADDDLVTRITYTDAEIVAAVNAPQPVDLDDSDQFNLAPGLQNKVFYTYKLFYNYKNLF